MYLTINEFDTNKVEEIKKRVLRSKWMCKLLTPIISKIEHDLDSRPHCVAHVICSKLANREN